MDSEKKISGTLEQLLRHGFLLMDEAQLTEAADLFQQLLNQFPHEPNSLYGLGMVAYKQHHLHEAKTYLTEVLTVLPDHIASLEGLAAIAIEEKNWPEAESMLQKRLILEPNNAVAYFNMAYCFQQQGKIEDAKQWYTKALIYNPEYPACLLNLAGMYRLQEDWTNAETLYLKALALKPDYVLALVHLGGLYEQQDRLEAAQHYYEQALTADPHNPDILTYLAVLSQKQSHYKLAEKYYLEALHQDPEHVGARFNFSLLQLLRGEFAQGWALNQARKQIAPEIMPLKQHLPWWDGKTISSQETLYVLPEQGYGDYIMMIRCAQALQAQGLKVVAVHKDPILPLLKTCPWLSEAIDVGQFAQRSQGYQVMLGDLPGMIGVNAATIPHQVPYFFAPPEKREALQARLAGLVGMKVGICWAGSQHFAGDKARSIALEKIKALLDFHQVTWVNLTSRNDALLGAGFPKVVDVSDLLEDFSDTATVLEQLDLLISVDTAVAHLAGAMNRPCWVLLPKVPDWRWQLNRSDSPWYPSIVLFRQKRAGNWNDVVTEVLQALKQHCSKKSAKPRSK